MFGVVSLASLAVITASGRSPTSLSTTDVVLRHGSRTTFVTQLDYDGPADEIAFVVTVPATVTEADVAIIAPSLIDALDRDDAPELERQWTAAPCSEPTREDHPYQLSARKHATRAPSRTGDVDAAIVVRRPVGEWLRQHGFTAPNDIENADAVVVVRASVVDGHSRLEPVQIEWTSADFTVPLLPGHDSVVHLVDDAHVEQRVKREASLPAMEQPDITNVDARAAARFDDYHAARLDRMLGSGPSQVVESVADHAEWRRRGGQSTRLVLRAGAAGETRLVPRVHEPSKLLLSHAWERPVLCESPSKESTSDHPAVPYVDAPRAVATDAELLAEAPQRRAPPIWKGLLAGLVLGIVFTGFRLRQRDTRTTAK